MKPSFEHMQQGGNSLENDAIHATGLFTERIYDFQNFLEPISFEIGTPRFVLSKYREQSAIFVCGTENEMLKCFGHYFISGIGREWNWTSEDFFGFIHFIEISGIADYVSYLENEYSRFPVFIEPWWLAKNDELKQQLKRLPVTRKTIYRQSAGYAVPVNI